MRRFIFLLLLGFLTFPVYSQIDVSFKKDTLNYVQSAKDQVKVITIVTDTTRTTKKDLDVAIEVDYSKSSLDASKFTLNFNKTKVTALQPNTSAFLQIKADSTSKDAKKIVLNLKIYDKNAKEDKNENKGQYKTLVINIAPFHTKLSGYEYLAYVGTNFDLVEGIQAKDLFFAANIYKQPRSKLYKKGVGFYLSLYGNRAFTYVDSSGFAVRTKRYEPVTDSTYQEIISTNYLLSRRTTDNLGSYISPLINLKWFRNKDANSNIKLYYSPSLEFVYRRTKISFEETGVVQVDSLNMIQGDINEVLPLRNNNQPIFSETFNEYSFNAGIIGLFLSLENKDLSVRVHGSVGYSSNFFVQFDPNDTDVITSQKSDIFFSGRAWITEATTGLTLQAEVTNSAIHPRPFFVATLSKAFAFKKLGSIFQPITSR